MTKISKVLEMKKLLLTLAVLVLLAPLGCSQEKVLSIKADGSWRASKAVSGDDWIQTSFDDSSWVNATPNWQHGPCSTYCGKIMSCMVACNDWMWTANSCENCMSFFRKSFAIDGEIVSGSVTISADEYYWLYVNGRLIGSTEGKKVSYALSDTYDISNFLHPSANVIAIKVENRREFEGVVVRSDIKYRSVDPLVGQLQAQVGTLKAQIDTLGADKTRLEGQVDSLQKDKASLTSGKEQLLQQVSAFQLENTNLKTELEQTKLELESSSSRYRTFVILLVLALLVALVGLGFCIHYIYEKSKPRYPALSGSPMKKAVHLRKPSTIEGKLPAEDAKSEVDEPELPHKKSVHYESLKEEGRSSGSQLFK